MLRIGIVAGEASGDYLGAQLIRALKAQHGDVVIEGIGGSKMQLEGCRSFFPMEKLSIMGIVEVLGSYLELAGIRRRLLAHFSAHIPDVFIGIDAPDFNLGLERRLRKKGIMTVHYVSPSVWAWRQYRIRKIGRSVDLMLTLFPFELDIYRQNNIRAECVGHPLAAQIGMQADRQAARARLGLDQDKTIVGIMPGSRKSELDRLLPVFLQTAALMYAGSADIQFISSLIDAATAACFRRIQSRSSCRQLPLQLYQDRAHDVLEAADVLLLASGTITLEALLFKRPMVVAYKLNPVTHYLVKILARVDHVSLPNLLAGRALVPECLQQACQPARLYSCLQNWLNDAAKVAELEAECYRIHASLLKNNHQKAADAILNLCNQKSVGFRCP